MKTCPNCNELLGDNADRCFKCRYDFKLRRVPSSSELQQQQMVKEKEQIERHNVQSAQNNLKNTMLDNSVNKLAKVTAINDIYEYDVVSIVDDSTGKLNIQAIKNTLTQHGIEGWRLVSSFSNELGHNSSTISAYGMSSGTNTTIDQAILIFERCIKRYQSNEDK